MKPGSNTDGSKLAKSAIVSARSLHQDDRGNSLLETAAFAPLMVLLVCYAINFGYYFIVALNLTAASRTAAEYSIQGFSSPGASTLPAAGSTTTAGSVAALALGDLGNLLKSSTTTSVEVCSQSANTSGTTAVQCASYGANTLSYTPDTDPESSMFQCNRIDIVYTVNPPIPITLFKMSWTPPATFHRSVEMRAMN
jgi:Flp pilus assembly protein TadG